MLYQKKNIEPQRRKGRQVNNARFFIVQNRVTVLHKEAFSFAASRQKKIDPSLAFLPLRSLRLKRSERLVLLT
jgi:hypothetical protein